VNRAQRAWYRLTNARHTKYRNWLSRRAWERGKTPLPDRIARQFTSRLPVYRNRINRGTGRPHRDDLTLGRSADRAMARMRTRNDAVVAQSAARRDARAAANQQHVRDTLTAREPQYAQAVERAARDVARDRTARRPARTGRTRLWAHGSFRA
jgi:hypothetical protein